MLTVARAAGALALTCLPLLPTTMQAQTGVGTIAGIVTDSSGNPLDGAEVVLLEQQRGVRTAANGLFRLERVPVGHNVVYVRRLAFREVTAFVTVSAGDTADVAVELEMIAHPLAPVIVAASRRLAVSGRMADFERRRRMGIGKFLDRKQIEDINSLYMSDVLRRVPGLRLMLNDKGKWVVRMARAVGLNNSTCQPQFYLDGMLYPVVDVLGIDAIFATDLEAVEVFRGPSEVPPQYGGANAACGVILVWTRVGQGGD